MRSILIGLRPPIAFPLVRVFLSPGTCCTTSPGSPRPPHRENCLARHWLVCPLFSCRWFQLVIHYARAFTRFCHTGVSFSALLAVALSPLLPATSGPIFRLPTSSSHQAALLFLGSSEPRIRCFSHLFPIKASPPSTRCSCSTLPAALISGICRSVLFLAPRLSLHSLFGFGCNYTSPFRAWRDFFAAWPAHCWPALTHSPYSCYLALFARAMDSRPLPFFPGSLRLYLLTHLIALASLVLSPGGPVFSFMPFGPVPPCYCLFLGATFTSPRISGAFSVCFGPPYRSVPTPFTLSVPRSPFTLQHFPLSHIPYPALSAARHHPRPFPSLRFGYFHVIVLIFFSVILFTSYLEAAFGLSFQFSHDFFTNESEFFPPGPPITSLPNVHGLRSHPGKAQLSINVM